MIAISWPILAMAVQFFCAAHSLVYPQPGKFSRQVRAFYLGLNMKNRAYSVLQIKEMDDEKRIITGIASTPTPDRMDDIVEPKGAQFTLPIPFLWQHRHAEPVGHVVDASVS